MENIPHTSEQDEAPQTAELLEHIKETDLTVYEVLSPTNETAAREAFLADPTMEVPPFEYGRVNPDKINANLEALQALRQESDEPVVGYLAEANSKANAFVRDCHDFTTAETDKERQAAAEAQRFSGEALYGKPDRAIWATLLRKELAKIDVESLSPEDRKVYDELVAQIGEIEGDEEEAFKPKPETVAQFSEKLHILFENFFKHIPEDKDEFTTEEACAIAQEIIRDEIGEDATQYRAVMSNETTTCQVDHIKRQIIFPVERSAGNFTRNGLMKILVHELGTHFYRAMVYEGDDVPALSRGMPGNEDIEEGIAKCCENAIDGKYSPSGVEHYINIGLAYFSGKSFREIFEIQQKLLYLKGCKADVEETPEEKQARFHAKDKTIFKRTMRCTRGTGVLPNCKDLVYLNGAARVWKFIEEHIDDPDLFDQLFLSGKSDFLNPDQERIVYEKRTKAEI